MAKILFIKNLVSPGTGMDNALFRYIGKAMRILKSTYKNSVLVGTKRANSITLNYICLQISSYAI